MDDKRNTFWEDDAWFYMQEHMPGVIIRFGYSNLNKCWIYQKIGIFYPMGELRNG